MQMGFETLEEMEAEFGEYYSDYDREKDVFVDDDGYYHLVHRNIFYRVTATYSDDKIYFKSVERLSSVEGVSMIKRGDGVAFETDTAISVYKDGCSVNAGEGVFPYGVSLNIEKLTSGILFFNAQKAMENLCEKMTVYEITAMRNNMKVQPNGTVTVTFDIPKDYDMDKVAVFYVSPEGEAEKLKSEVDENGTFATVKLTHFSTYVLAETKDAVVAAPKTVDGSQIVYPAVLLFVSGAAIALISFDKKRKFVM